MKYNFKKYVWNVSTDENAKIQTKKINYFISKTFLNLNATPLL